MVMETKEANYVVLLVKNASLCLSLFFFFLIAPDIRRRLQTREEGEREPSATIKSQTNCSKFFFFFFRRMKPE